VQIESLNQEGNPYNHSAEDTVAHLDLDYWVEHIRATVAIAAHLLMPVLGDR
jgi:hypothetical protein